MASKSNKVDQVASNLVLARFNLGDLVSAFSIDGILYVICPNFGSNDEYTKVKDLDKYTKEEDLEWLQWNRLYHVQRIGRSFEQAWIHQEQLYPVKHIKDYMAQMNEDLMALEGASINEVTLKYCQMFVKKTNEELVEICRMRYETYHSFMKSSHQKLNKVTEIEFHDFKEFVTSQYQYDYEHENWQKPWNEQKTWQTIGLMRNELKSLNDSFEEFHISFVSQNQDQPKNEQKTDSNNENAKEIKLEKVEDHVEDVPKLNQIIKDLKIDNSKLSKENEDYVKVQKQNEAEIKNLKEDLLKLSQENADLKYGKNSVIENLNEELLKLSKEIADLKYGKQSKNGSC